MSKQKKASPDWKEFERLVARIEADAGPIGLNITSPDRLRCKITGRLREVDASVRTKIGTSDVLLTLECRKRRPKQDVTWIEQLATKRDNIGAARTIAISSAGFSADAEKLAQHHGIDLRRLAEVSVAEINQLMRLDFVLFTHKRCWITKVAFRWFRSIGWKLPEPDSFDFVLPAGDEPTRLLFTNTETGAIWSVNDLWLQLQEATDPFSGIEKDRPPIIRTACFPYPGTVTVETPDGPKALGDVILSVALALDVEQVDLASARKVEYSGTEGNALQRVEFASREPGMEDWRISLQMPKDSEDLGQLRKRLDQPMHKSRRTKRCT